MEKTLNLTHPETISAADALWTLIVKQNKSVQKDLARRLSKLLMKDSIESQQSYIKETLDNAMAEVRESQKTGNPLPDGRHLLDDIDD